MIERYASKRHIMESVRRGRVSRPIFFFFNDTATTEIYTLSLHDALPIWPAAARCRWRDRPGGRAVGRAPEPVRARDRKSTRLNSSHANISYAVFCLKKKKHDNSQNLISHTGTTVSDPVYDTVSRLTLTSS